jgi:hypothetical protein
MNQSLKVCISNPSVLARLYSFVIMYQNEWRYHWRSTFLVSIKESMRIQTQQNLEVVPFVVNDYSWCFTWHNFSHSRLQTKKYVIYSHAWKFLDQKNCSICLYFKSTEGIPKSTTFPLFIFLLRLFFISSSRPFSLSTFPPQSTKIRGIVCFLSYTFRQV